MGALVNRDEISHPYKPVWRLIGVRNDGYDESGFAPKGVPFGKMTESGFWIELIDGFNETPIVAFEKNKLFPCASFTISQQPEIRAAIKRSLENFIIDKRIPLCKM